MKRVALLLCCAFSACDATDEMRAWDSRREELTERLKTLHADEARLNEAAPRLTQLRDESQTLTAELDLAGQVKTLAPRGVKLFQSGDALRLVIDDETEVCRDAVRALAPLRWLTGGWKLRLSQGHCHWESSQDFVLTHHVEETVRPKVWSAPPSSLLSRKMDERRQSVAVLETELRALETKLGPLQQLSALEAHVSRLRSVRDELKTHPAPCDLPVLERAAAQPRGTLLEIESARLIDPLEPLADERLKGLAVVENGQLRWTCAE